MVIVPSVPAQIDGFVPETAIAGLGVTVIVNVCGVPVQPPKDGVTDIVEVIGAPVPLIPMNEAIFPEPLAARPILVLVFVQLYVVPAIEPVKFIADVDPPAQML